MIIISSYPMGLLVEYHIIISSYHIIISLRQIWFSHLGWWNMMKFPRHGKIENVPNHQPANPMNITIEISLVRPAMLKKIKLRVMWIPRAFSNDLGISWQWNIALGPRTYGDTGWLQNRIGIRWYLLYTVSPYVSPQGGLQLSLKTLFWSWFWMAMAQLKEKKEMIKAFHDSMCTRHIPLFAVHMSRHWNSDARGAGPERPAHLAFFQVQASALVRTGEEMQKFMFIFIVKRFITRKFQQVWSCMPSAEWDDIYKYIIVYSDSHQSLGSRWTQRSISASLQLPDTGRAN